MRLASSKHFLPLPTGAYAAIYVLMLSCLAAVVAYYGMFIGFSVYDDEGTMMILVKQYLTGHRLYDEIWSSYGPIYYSFNWFVRIVSATAVSHNTTRITSVVWWVLSALLCFWIVFRLTNSVALAAVAHLITFRELAFFRNEPGHPQECAFCC